MSRFSLDLAQSLTCEPIPKLRSIEKKATAQKGECGIIVKPFGYTFGKVDLIFMVL